MNCFCYYIVITNSEDGWARINYSVTFRHRHCHYFHCPYIFPSGCVASWVYSSTTFRESILSWIRRQRRRSLLSFLPKCGYSIVLINQYLHLNNAPGVCNFSNILLFILFIFYKFYHTFLWSVRNDAIHRLLDILFCTLDYSYLYYVYIIILYNSKLNCSFNILFRSLYYCFLTRIIIYNMIIFCLSSISMLNYKYFCKIYND